MPTGTNNVWAFIDCAERTNALQVCKHCADILRSLVLQQHTVLLQEVTNLIVLLLSVARISQTLTSPDKYVSSLGAHVRILLLHRDRIIFFFLSRGTFLSE